MNERAAIPAAPLISRIGDAAARVGLGRPMAQMYALLLMSEEPLSLDDIARALGVSKANVSVRARELAGLGAIRKVWAPETRRDLYEAEGDILKVVRLWAQTGIARRIAETGEVLAEAERFLAGARSCAGGEMPRVQERVAAAKALHAKLASALALLPALLGGAGEPAAGGPGSDGGAARSAAPRAARRRRGGGGGARGRAD